MYTTDLDSNSKEISHTSHTSHEISYKNLNTMKFKWNNMNEKWNDILLSDKFMIKDCLSDGNCQFKSVEEAIKKKYSYKKLRKMVVKYILTMNDLEFNTILNNFKIEKEKSPFFYSNWDPMKIKTKKQLALEIKKPGFNFNGPLGMSFILSILSKILSIDIIIINENTSFFTIKNTLSDKNKLIILYFTQNRNDASGHYQTIGLKNSDTNKKLPITIFDKTKLPNEITTAVFIDNHILLSKHIQKFYETCNQNNIVFTCNNVINYIEHLVKLKENDKILLFKLLAEFVNIDN